MDTFSILFYNPQIMRQAESYGFKGNGSGMPEFFKDLNLHQIIGEILTDKEEYHLEAFFYRQPNDIGTINYRLEIMKELEKPVIFKMMKDFSVEMKKVREFTGYSQTLSSQDQREKWHLDAAVRYCGAVMNLSETLLSVDLESNGLRLLSSWLAEYTSSVEFKSFYNDTDSLKKEFGNIKYCLHIHRDKIVVGIDESENDFCAQIYSTFEKFNRTKFDYEISYFTDLHMCNLENKILKIIKKINTAMFNRLDGYCSKYADFIDLTAARFDREVQFYLSYLDYIGKIKRKGLHFCYPYFSLDKEINIVQGYDLALANNRLDSVMSIVPNDFSLDSGERIFILTGPNQGGKTTFARTLGQILFLASIGCAIPCRKAEVFLFYNIYTHFTLEENLSMNAGRLKEELCRLKQITEMATGNSIIILNELFASTTTLDAYEMGKMLLDYFTKLDCVCLYVTHIFELAGISNKVVSLVAEVISEKEAISVNKVVEGEKAVRSYKIVRKPPNGLAYANSIVEKYMLNYSQIKERIKI